VEFRSDRFPPEPRSLAEFLAEGLRGHGFASRGPFAEDWGWCIPIENERFALWVGCSNDDDRPDGFVCFIEPHQPTIKKLFKRIDTRPRVEALQRALDAVLSDPSIRDKRWWTHDEFNRPTPAT